MEDEKGAGARIVPLGHENQGKDKMEWAPLPLFTILPISGILQKQV
jgi:hypothetical protein